MDKLAANLFVKKHHKKVICVAKNYIETTVENPIIYDVPLSSVRKSGIDLLVAPHENLRVGINLGVFFGKELKRTNAWDRQRRLDESILGYFVALKFHNHDAFKRAH